MITDVVAALIWDHDRFLACQRPAHKARGLLWEFVGGKVEPGETFEDALIRECKEELGVTISVGNLFMTLIHAYPDLTVRLTLFNANIVGGFIRKLEHNDIRWITTKEIDQYAFCPADVEILEKLKTIDNAVHAELLSLADGDYKKFQSALIPTMDPAKMLGVRMPALRKFAKKMKSAGEHTAFLNDLPHRFYEEDNIHGILISAMSDTSAVIEELDSFLPFVDNWATCDLITPKVFKERPEALISKIKEWLSKDEPYTVRFAIGALMRYYLDDGFSTEYLNMVGQIESDEYYVKMMQAWYFATALAKQYDDTIRIFETQKLPKWVHNKAIQKAIESYRVTFEHKQHLRSLKMK